MELTLVTDSTPDKEPVSLAEAKAYLRQDSHADDDTIQGLITAARLEAENENGRELSQKQWILALDRFPLGGYADQFVFDIPLIGRFYRFGFGRERITLLDPLISVDSFTYKTSDATTTTLAANVDYIADPLKHPGIVCPAPPNCQWNTAPTGTTGIPWPSSAVQITFTAGFTPDNVPSSIKQGIMMLVSQWYEARIPFEAVRFVAEIPFSVTSLFRNNKLWRF